jgi:hypothetical protein
MITKSELLQGRDKTFADEYTDAISDNLDVLVQKLNVLRAAYGKPMKVNSGFRPPSVNSMTAGASKNSLHSIGKACDFSDPDGALFRWCLANLDILDSLGLYLEDPRWTRTKTGGWLHVQDIAPKSKKRIFVPNQSLPVDPNFFDGRYDSKWNR